MSRKRTAENMVADVRQRCDMEGSEFVTDSEILEYINQELAELRARIRRAEGSPHARSSGTIPVVAGTSLYPFDANGMADFWELLSVEATIGGVNRRLDSFMEGERARLSQQQYNPFTNSPRYRVQGSSIEFLPATQNFTATIFYVPAEPRLAFAPGSPNEVDGYNGYEIAAIYGACATCLQKEESDPSFYMAQKERIYRHIDANAAQRDGANPERVQDVVGLDNDFYLY